MKITYQERIGEDGEPVSAPVIPPTATVDEIEAIVAMKGAAVMTDKQAAELSAYLAEGVTPAGAASAETWRGRGYCPKDPCECCNGPGLCAEACARTGETP